MLVTMQLTTESTVEIAPLPHSQCSTEWLKIDAQAQIVPDSVQRRFRSVTFCDFGFSSWSFSNMAAHMW